MVQVETYTGIFKDAAPVVRTSNRKPFQVVSRDEAARTLRDARKVHRAVQNPKWKSIDEYRQAYAEWWSKQPPDWKDRPEWVLSQVTYRKPRKTVYR